MADATATAEAPPEQAATATDAAPVGPVTVQMSAEEVAEAAAAADSAAAARSAAQESGKGKKAKKAKSAPVVTGDGPSVAAHPRAVRSIARAKSWGGLIGFLVAGYLSLPTYTFVGVGLRALLAGVACYVAVWAGAVFLWRRLVVLEIKAREQQLMNEVLSAAERAQGPGGAISS